MLRGSGGRTDARVVLATSFKRNFNPRFLSEREAYDVPNTVHQYLGSECDL